MKAVSTIFLVILTSTIMLAQTPPGPFLVNADIDRFIATQSQMTTEFEALEDSMEDEEDEAETYEEILASYREALQDNEAIQIIKKYGWDVDTYGEKMMAIAMGTTYLIATKQMQEMPAEQRALMEEMFVKQYKTYIHPDDLKVLKPRLAELEEIFQELEED